MESGKWEVESGIGLDDSSLRLCLCESARVCTSAGVSVGVSVSVGVGMSVSRYAGI